MTQMSVEVRITFNEKSYSLERERHDYWPIAGESIQGFVRETLTEVIADIERLESQ